MLLGERSLLGYCSGGKLDRRSGSLGVFCSLVRNVDEEELQEVYKPLPDLFRRLLALGISRQPEFAEKSTANAHCTGLRGMRLERYFIGAFILALLGIIFGRTFFERKPVLAVTLSGAYILFVVDGGYLKSR